MKKYSVARSGLSHLRILAACCLVAGSAEACKLNN
jgi:hypothetical protein